MLGGLPQAGVRALGGSRFLLINVVPGALTTLVVVGALRANLYSRGTVDLSQAVPTGWVVLQLGFGMLLLGVMAQPFQVAIVQALEGYGWNRWMPPVLAEVARERHRRRFAGIDWMEFAEPTAPTGRSLDAAVKYARSATRAARLSEKASQRRRDYPTEAELLMPTQLGNVLRAAEESAGGRYGLDSMTVYPRMYPCVSRKLDTAIRHQLDLLDTTGALCVSFGAVVLATTPILLIRRDLWGVLPVIFTALAWLAYQGAVRAARDHGELLATAFDLHRFDMIEHLRYPLPMNAREELRFNRALSRFLADQQPLPEAEPQTQRVLAKYRHTRPPSQQQGSSS